MSNKDERIINRILDHLDFYQERYSNDWVGIFLQGSQNYGLDTESSDIDTKIIVLPSLEDLILNRKPISHTIVLPNNEHCDVKDIRLMFDCFKKQNINFLEILFTPWCIQNPEYEDLFYTVIHNRERIARYNEFVSVECMNGMILQKHKSMFKPTPATGAVIEQYGYNGKDLCHMVRVHNFMNDFLCGRKSFSECLATPQPIRDICMEAKAHKYSLEEATNIADTIDAGALFLRNAVRDRLCKADYRPDAGVDTLLHDVLKSILTHAFRKELAHA